MKLKTVNGGQIVKFSRPTVGLCLDTKWAENGDGEMVNPSWCLSGSWTPCGTRISKFCTSLAMNMNMFVLANTSPRHLLLPARNENPNRMSTISNLFYRLKTFRGWGARRNSCIALPMPNAISQLSCMIFPVLSRNRSGRNTSGSPQCCWSMWILHILANIKVSWNRISLIDHFFFLHASLSYFWYYVLL